MALPEVLPTTGAVIQESTGIHYNKHHHTQSLPPISNDEQVRVKTDSEQQNGIIVKPADTPQSYVVETNSGSVRCNR